jgi:Mce-associated membrane protein
LPTWKRKSLTALAAVVAVAAIAAVVACYRYSQADTSFTDEQYMRAATERVQVLLTPEAGDNGTRGRQILGGATGSFRDEFAQSTDAFTRFVQQIGTVSTGTVDGVGISSRTDQQATLLVTAAISVRTGLDADPAPALLTQRFRVQVDMVPDDGALKISALEFYP